MDNRHQILAKLLLSIALFAIIFYLIGWNEALLILSKVRGEYILYAVLCYACLNMVMSYRIKIVLEKVGDKLTMMQIIPSNLAGLLASDFTPARVGYFFTAFSISSKYDISTDRTVITIFGPQIFDFLIKASSAAILMLLIMYHVGMGGIYLSIALIIVIFSGIIFAGLIVFHPPLLERLSFFERFPVVPRIFSFLRAMHDHSEKVLSMKWSIVWITLLSWFFKGLEWLFLSRALSISITGNALYDLLFMMVFQGAITILQFLPIPTLAGAGASEAGFGAILLIFGVPVAVGVIFGVLTRLLMITVDLLSLPVVLDYLHKHTLESALGGMSRLH